MKIFLFILMYIYIYTILKNIIALIYTNKLLKNAKKSIIYNLDEKYEKNVYLIIPMLNEQKIANETYLNFKTIVDEMENVKVMFITTSKEKKEIGKETTFEILEKLVKNEKKMFVYNYDNENGVMAHQINYAIRIILKQRAKNEKILIGVYNADSQIHSDVIRYILNDDKKRNINDRVCYQQYSWYRIKNDKNKKGIIQSAALWQTRWSLTFEIFRVKQQRIINSIYNYFNKIKFFIPFNKMFYVIFEKMNYVIGHGFFINIDLLKDLGGIPEDTINEDAFLGYLINNKNIKIEVIPYLEKADFAPNTSIYIKQQATWVNGPIYAFQYYKLYLKKEKLSIKEKIRAFILAIKLFFHFIYWLISPYILLFIMPILLFKYYSISGLLISFLIIFLHLPFTHYLVRKVVLNNIKKEEYCELSKSSVFCIIFFLVHTFGPIKNIYMQLLGKNNKENKYKTERE